MMNNAKTYFLKKFNTNQGFTLVEMLVATAILLVMLTGGYMILFSGQQTWATTEASIRVEENLRQVLDRVSKELRESGGGDTTKVDITNDAGVNGSDILKFSMPIVCQSGGNIANVSGDVANWGAPLTWGCNDSSCMDADEDCATLDYSNVEYRVDSSNQLVRRVLNAASNAVRTDIFASNITGLQVVFVDEDDDGTDDEKDVVRLTVTSQVTSTLNRTITKTKSLDVRLRNRG